MRQIRFLLEEGYRSAERERFKDWQSCQDCQSFCRGVLQYRHRTATNTRPTGFNL
jgi:hypothetical protein